MKNKVVVIQISDDEWNKSKKETLKILQFWLKSGIKSDIELISQVETFKLEKRMKNPRGKSEAMASHIFSLRNDTKLIYSNEKYSPTNGESHGIDLGHISNDETILYVIEVKYTEKNTTQNFTKAKFELLSRFDPQKQEQLTQLLTEALKNNYVDANLAREIHWKFVEKNLPNMLDSMPSSLVPTALVVSHRTTQPKEDLQLFKVLYKLEPEK